MRTWIVVCDASRARFFMARNGNPQWVKFEEFEHPAARTKNLELVSDARGRRSQQMGEGSTGQMERGITPHQVEAIRFAHYIGETLNSAHAQDAFDRLIIVAPPNFLGHLRNELSDRVKKCIYGTLDRDYTQLDEWQLQERISV